jgi:integrase
MWIERNGKTWRIRDETGGRKVDLAAGYPTKTAARDAMTLLKADELRGEALKPRGGKTTLNAHLDVWWPHYERGLKPTSAHSEGGRIRNHIRPILGHLALDDIDVATVQEWVAYLGEGDQNPANPGKWLRKPLSPKTIHNCHGLLHTILNAAVDYKLIRLNPCTGSAKTLPKRVFREMRFLTDPEIARLIAALPPHWRPLVTLLVATGLRWGEATGLKVGRVDLAASPPRLRVEEQMQELSGTGELVFSSPKTARSRRTVSFTRPVALTLAPLLAGRERSELVFRTPTGRPVRTRNFRRVWLRACAAVGVAGTRVHDLRHTHAAILIAANRQLSAISRRLGHSSIAVTDALYGHIREEVDEGILAAIAAALALVGPADMAGEIAAETGSPLSAP